MNKQGHVTGLRKALAMREKRTVIARIERLAEFIRRSNQLNQAVRISDNEADLLQRIAVKLRDV